ncbi:MAG: hypothetical protein IPJ71_12215 [Bdellovibrionales bacterium]|nr:hypothetical protein [Bdellovibrionales bacterium]
MIERVTASIRHLILILASTTLVQATPAGASKCEQMLRAGQISSRERTASLSTSENLRKFQSLAFDVVDYQPGKHGGKRLIVKRKGPWFDFKNELDEKVGDAVLDLRANIFLLGEKEAAFFGFELLDDFTLTVPDVMELNGAISRFNSGLRTEDPRRIVISVYEIPDVTNSIKDYLGNFIHNGQIPISQKGKGFFHDIGVHAIEGFFVDNRLVEIIKSRTGLIGELLSELRADLDGKSVLPEFKRVSVEIRNDLASMIDQIGAFGSRFLNPEARFFLGRSGLQQYEAVKDDPKLKELLPYELFGYMKLEGATAPFFFHRFWTAMETDFPNLLKNKIVEQLRREIENGRDLTSDDEVILEALERKIDSFALRNVSLDKGPYDRKILDHQSYTIEKWRKERSTVAALRSAFQRVRQMIQRPNTSTLSPWEQRLQSLDISNPFIARLQYLRQIIGENP